MKFLNLIYSRDDMHIKNTAENG